MLTGGFVQAFGGKRSGWSSVPASYNCAKLSVRHPRSAPQALAAIRDVALNLIRKTGQKPRPAREAFAEQKWKAIRLVRQA